MKKNLLSIIMALLILPNCEEKEKLELSHEILYEMNIYGKWHLFESSGGLAGGFTETNFNILNIKEPAKFELYYNSKLVSTGTAKVTKKLDSIRCIAELNTETGNFTWENEIGNDIYLELDSLNRLQVYNTVTDFGYRFYYFAKVDQQD